MASRRDELNAYAFARKRVVGAFLQPSGGGNDEDAPKPVRAVLPSIVVAVVITAGFGMAGVISPSAPQGWDDGKSIIQGKDSTTRYVVLIDPKTKTKVLHQVLNMSSARLVLPAGAKTQIVADSVLDAYQNHGPTIGIPYAPDRLPKPEDAGVAKKWSVCDRPGKDGLQANINQTLVVAADKEAKALAKPDLMLGAGQSLFVEAPPIGDNPASEYLVDSMGYKHAIGKSETVLKDGSDRKQSEADRKLWETNRRAMEAALFGSDAQPQNVTQEWLDTLDNGAAITFPDIPDFDGTSALQSHVALTQTSERVVGRLLSYQNDTFYVVGRDKLYLVTAFQAWLIANNPALKVVYPGVGGTPKPAELSPSDYATLKDSMDASLKPADKDKLPSQKPAPHAVNFTGNGGGRTVLCSTYEGVMDGDKPRRTVWAGTDYPVPVSSGSSTAHVSPGHGLLFRSLDGTGGSGSNFLITETGLRYSVQSNNDGGKGPTASAAPQDPQAQQQQGDNSQARLGYDKIQPVLVPKEWANLAPAGPVLNTAAATQPQNA